MKLRSRKFLLASALVAPLLELSAISIVSAQIVNVERSEQDNVSFVGATEGEVERLIRELGPTDLWDSTDKAEPVVPVHLRRIADEIIALYQNQKYGEVIRIAGENLDVQAARPEINVLVAWSRYHSGEARAAMKLFQDLYVNEPSPEHAAGVIYSGMRSEFYTRTDAFARAHRGPLAEILKPGKKVRAGAPKTSVEKTQVDFLNGWLRAAIRYRKFETADKVATLLGLNGYADIRAELLISAGWSAHKARSYGKAAGLFAEIAALTASPERMREAVYGHALSLRDEGNVEEAIGLVKTISAPDARTLELLGQMILVQAQDAFDAQNYVSSLQLVLSTRSSDNEPRAAWMLEGWSLLKLERIEEAAEVFVAAYRQAPDQESADGAVAALMALGRRDELVALSLSIEGPLEPPAAVPEAQIYVMSDEERAFYRGDFASAAAVKPELAQTLETWAGLTLSHKYRGGDKGLGKLAMTGSKASFDWTNKDLHLRAELEALYLDTGGVPGNPLLSGSRAPGDVRPFAASIDDTVFQPSFHLRKEGKQGLEASLGLSPLGGEVDPTITGHIDFIHNQKGAWYSVGVHRTSLYESLLSISGMRDTVTGKSWGGVVESGVHGALYRPINDTLAITAEAKRGERSGEDVDTNKTSFLTLGAAYSLDAEGFSYLTVGPSISQTNFDKNRSFFTYGHGGYYSPAGAQNVSLNLNFRTDEARVWIAQGSMSLGYEKAKSDAAPFYPLDVQAGDGFYQASTSEGGAFAVQAVLARRLGHDLILEAGAYGIQTEDYSEAAAFLKLRVIFGKRSKVWRTDLTEDLYRKYH
jgi:tetratricopeptide (TPR) repeat protein